MLAYPDFCVAERAKRILDLIDIVETETTMQLMSLANVTEW